MGNFPAVLNFNRSISTNCRFSPIIGEDRILRAPVAPPNRVIIECKWAGGGHRLWNLVSLIMWSYAMQL